MPTRHADVNLVRIVLKAQFVCMLLLVVVVINASVSWSGNPS